MTAATIMAALRNKSGQFAKVNRAMRRHLHGIEGKSVGRFLHRTPPPQSQKARVRRAAKRCAPRLANRSDLDASSRGGADRGADRGKRRVGVLTESGNGADANHDDQGQHDRVLDGRRAVFTLQELNHEVAKLTHGSSPFTKEL